MPLINEFYEIPKESWVQIDHTIKNDFDNDSREPIRQWLLNELITTYLYPKNWIGSQIVPIEEKISTNIDNLFGLAVCTSDGDPFLLVSIDSPGKSTIAMEKLQLALENAIVTRLGIFSDGSAAGTKIIRKKSKNSEVEYIPDIELYINPNRSGSALPYVAPSTENKKQNGKLLQKITKQVENLFFDVHSIIRDIDGIHSDEALDELSKLLYVKMYDEERTSSNMPYKVQRWIYGTTEECATSIRRLYIEANEYDVRVFSLRIPGYKRSRGVFDSQIKLSSPALAKVAEAFETYNISFSDFDVKGRAFQKLILPALRAGMGQYFTPDPVVKFMVKSLEPKHSELILDPFAGSGHFLTQSLKYCKNNTKKGEEKLFNEFAFNKLHGIEKSETMVRIAMTDMRLHGDGHSNIRCSDSLLDLNNYQDIQAESFDVILTNPPFGSILGKEARSQLGAFELAQKRTRVPIEILGLERCVEFLQQCGRIGIVLPESIFVNQSTKYVRTWIQSNLKIRAIISLPVETFAPFGANIRTKILFGRKWKVGEDRVSSYKIFIAHSDNVGYDSSGNLKQDSDLDALSFKFLNFIHEDGW